MGNEASCMQWLRILTVVHMHNLCLFMHVCPELKLLFGNGNLAAFTLRHAAAGLVNLLRAETKKAFSHAIAGLLVNAELRAGRDTALGPSFFVRSAITIMELEGVSIHMLHIIHILFSPWPNSNESSQQ